MNTSEKDIREYFNQRFTDFSKTLNGSQNRELKQLRLEAMGAFSERGFPLSKDEEYKYTPITRTLLKSLQLSGKQVTEPTMVPPGLSDGMTFSEHLIPGLDGYLVVFWNGQLVFYTDDLPDNLIIEHLDPLNSAQQDNLVSHLGKLVNVNSDAFAALNTAFFNQGSLITVKRNTTVDKPIIIYHLSDGQQGTTYTQTRHLVLAEMHSQSTIIEVYKNLSPDHQSFQNIATEIYLEENAQMNIDKVQTDCSGAILVDNTCIDQKKNSRLYCSTITTSGSMIRNNLNISINGENCESHMNGLYMLKGKDHVDNHTLVDHRIANSFSNEFYKGIVDEDATGVFNGKIYVQPYAQKTNAFQSNKNILLSDRASMNTKPQLEIWADDVKCSHGATIGQLDEDQVFYLRTRGLDEGQAKGLLLYAFATEFLEHISLPALADHLEEVIANRLYHRIS